MSFYFKKFSSADDLVPLPILPAANPRLPNREHRTEHQRPDLVLCSQVDYAWSFPCTPFAPTHVLHAPHTTSFTFSATFSQARLLISTLADRASV